MLPSSNVTQHLKRRIFPVALKHLKPFLAPKSGFPEATELGVIQMHCAIEVPKTVTLLEKRCPAKLTWNPTNSWFLDVVPFPRGLDCLGSMLLVFRGVNSLYDLLF